MAKGQLIHPALHTPATRERESHPTFLSEGKGPGQPELLLLPPPQAAFSPLFCPFRKGSEPHCPWHLVTYSGARGVP